ncbi:fumarylacetoacetate hydrolase family protein [Pseudomonas sp. WHRI 8519]|uniref:fumarylacetoacetate hydrolase family protein n=1 Tax=Pseudomonas sp. WHRI 8519 TaxID=3162567 RepID=UPI0032EFE9CB
MPPIPHARANGTLFGIALNYKGLLEQNLEDFENPPYRQPPKKPVLFIKTPNTRNAHRAVVVQPTGERLQPGPALGVVIGKRASRVTETAALQHVAGYVIVNEFSLPEDSYYRPAVKAKCRDGFCALGEDIVPADEIANPQNLTIKLYVNGEIAQENTTANQVRSVARLIAELSEFMTLDEGDVLITGTPEGRVDVQPGDVVEVEITGLGRLSNTVVAEQGESA